MLEVREQPVYMVRLKRATLTLPLLSWLHHEVLDKQLTMPFEEVRKRYVALRRCEYVIFLDLHPGQRPHLRGQIIAGPHVQLLLLHQRQPVLQPIVLGDDRVLLDGLFVPLPLLRDCCRDFGIICFAHRQNLQTIR